MNLIEILTILAVPISLFISVFGVFVGVAFSTRKNRREATVIIQQMSFGQSYLISLLKLWTEQFYWFFGHSYWSKRQIITIPLYTLTISVFFFLIWGLYLYIFNNPKHLIIAKFPISYKLAFKIYYETGIYFSIFIDLIVILMTKILLKVSKKYGYLSIKSLSLFLINITLSFLLFSFIVFIFRLYDMVSLYSSVAPNDDLPVLPYKPISYLISSLSLFTQETTIYVTSAGWYTTYFMHEPLLLYCAITTHAMFFLIFTISIISSFLSKLKKISLFFSKNIGTPKNNAFAIIIFSFLIITTLPITILILLALIF